MGAFDRALGRVSEAEREYRRTIGRSLYASVVATWSIAVFCAKVFAVSIFPTVQWAALAWILLSSSLIPAQAAGALIAAFLATAAGSFWLTLLYENGAELAPQQGAEAAKETGLWRNLWLLIVPLRDVTKFMVLYYAVWLTGSVALSYAYHRYYVSLPPNPLVELNEHWWRVATEQLPIRFSEMADWITDEIRGRAFHLDQSFSSSTE